MELLIDVDPGWQMDLNLLETYLKENTLLIEGISYSFHNQQTHQQLCLLMF
jgi:hypothetical protein